MNLNIVNYTGVPLFITHGKTGYKIGCGSEKIISITPSAARFTRFVAKYHGEDIPIKGMINLLLDSTLTSQNIILRAIIDGQAKPIYCLDQDAVRGAAPPAEVKNIQYQTYVYYNISVPIDGSTFGKIKQYLGISLSDVGCENRDAPFCDKIFGIPVILLLAIIFIIVCFAIFGLIIGGFIIKNKQ